MHTGPYLGIMFLIVIDAHSKWIDVQIVNSISAETTIAKLRTVFDNGSGFTSALFKEFMDHNGHILTSPYHPSSNGLAERAFQMLKSTVSKLEGSINVRLAQFLLTYRVTPQTTTGLSPAELLMGRRIRTRLDLLHPDTSKTVNDRQQRSINHKKPRKFKLGALYARNFHGEK